MRLAASTLVGLAAGASVLASVTAADARVFFGVGVGIPVVVTPAPVIVAPPPPPVAPAYVVPPGPAPGGYVWVPGGYVWTGAAYVWRAGAYLRPPWPGAFWTAGLRYHGPYGWAWRDGHWRR